MTVLPSIPRGMAPHVEAVLAGEYDTPGLNGIGRILDIGANCGAFSVWAARRFPGAAVHAYEPWPENYHALLTNVSDYISVYPYRLAIVGRLVPRVTLHAGYSNTGCVSEHDIGEQVLGCTVEVDAKPASSLPACDFLKVDTEGSELEIITAYLAAGHRPAAIVYEWHRHSDRTDLHDLLVRAEYTQVSESVWHPERGVARWLLTSLL